MSEPWQDDAPEVIFRAPLTDENIQSIIDGSPTRTGQIVAIHHNDDGTLCVQANVVFWQILLDLMYKKQPQGIESVLQCFLAAFRSAGLTEPHPRKDAP